MKNSPAETGNDSLSKRKSRSEHKRGPKKSKIDSTILNSTNNALPYGGFTMQDAERHIFNYNSRSGIDHGNETYFKLTRALVVAARRWRKLANDRIRAFKQNMARLEILYLVGYSDEELNQSQLARLISVEGSSMVHMLDALARDGLIERHQSSTDRRVTVNGITDRGQQVVHEIMKVTNELRIEIFRDIDPQQIEVTLQVLNTLLRRLEELQ